MNLSNSTSGNIIAESIKRVFYRQALQTLQLDQIKIKRSFLKLILFIRTFNQPEALSLQIISRKQCKA